MLCKSHVFPFSCPKSVISRHLLLCFDYLWPCYPVELQDCGTTAGSRDTFAEMLKFYVKLVIRPVVDRVSVRRWRNLEKVVGQ